MFRKFLKWLVLSVLSFILFIGFLLLVAALTMGPRVRENSVLVLDLSGPILEQGPQNWKEKLLMGEVLTTRDVIHALAKAKSDRRIRAVLVNALYSEAGIAKAQEIRAAIRNFATTTRKPVYGYIEDGGTTDYYLCSAAPRLYLPPDTDTWFTLIGVRAEVPFVKGTLDKLGIVAQMDHIGQYKSGPELYTRQDMSTPNREATNALLDSLFNRITSDIAADRKLSGHQLKQLINQGPLTSKELKDRHLVDGLLYRDELEGIIKKELGLKEINKITVLEYQKPTFSEAFGDRKNQIAIVYATGEIMSGPSSRGFGDEVVGSKTIVDAFRSVQENEAVKAVVFRVDSPGGSPSASDQIWRAVRITSKKKPVIVSMGDVAASGGYYISMGATKIFAEPSTITGSIGVYGGKFYMKGLYDKLGVTKEILKRGEHADLFSDYVPFDSEEWNIVHRHMQFTYDAFTRKAAEGRGKSQKEIDAIGQGRVWSGDQGLKLGLVDHIGGLRDALEEAKKMAHLAGKEVGISIYPASKGGFSDLFSGASIQSELPKEFKQLLSWARIAEREHVLLFMPYHFYLN